MNINFKATSIELTDAIRSYAEKRIETLEKIFGDGESSAIFDVELSKTTNHHKSGDIFRTEITARSGGNSYRTVSVMDDLYASIDEAKEELGRKIVAEKGKSQTLYRRGAKQIKNILKGISRIPSRFRKRS